MLNIWSKVTIVVGIGMGLLPLFHVWEMHSVRSSVGQSFLGALFLEFGIATWLVYGILKRDVVIIIANGIGIVAGLIYLLTIGHYS